MRRIRKTNTRPEMIVRRMVHAMGYRYRLHGANLPGTPDIVLPLHRKIMFVHGCFWHRHDCPAAAIERNRRRDEASIARLHELGWGVLIAWECDAKCAGAVRNRLRAFLA